MEAINLVIPSTTEKKMDAILALAKAVENVSKALISVQVAVTISNNEIHGAETAISVMLEEK